MRIEGVQSAEMVGKRCRKEPVGDFEKWRSREKVWEKLEQGRITSYIMKLHGFDQEVTKSMVGSWKDGRVKVNEVYFQIMEEVIVTISEILIEGFKFFKDKKLSTNVVRDFVEDEKELKALRKIDTYYVLDSMKKWWRYVLRAIIEYITLDPRFDRACTHHFVLLNHFWHNVKISFPFYLLTSMSKAVDNFKKKPIVNPTLHEGLLLVIYEHFKAQTISKAPPQAKIVEFGS